MICHFKIVTLTSENFKELKNMKKGTTDLKV